MELSEIGIDLAISNYRFALAKPDMVRGMLEGNFRKDRITGDFIGSKDNTCEPLRLSPAHSIELRICQRLSLRLCSRRTDNEVPRRIFRHAQTDKVTNGALLNIFRRNFRRPIRKQGRLICVATRIRLQLIIDQFRK
jgi:hypothetical protein